MSLVTSLSTKIHRNSKLSYLRQCLSYNIEQIFKMSEMFMIILLINSPFGIEYGKKFIVTSKW